MRKYDDTKYHEINNKGLADKMSEIDKGVDAQYVRRVTLKPHPLVPELYIGAEPDHCGVATVDGNEIYVCKCGIYPKWQFHNADNTEWYDWCEKPGILIRSSAP